MESGFYYTNSKHKKNTIKLLNLFLSNIIIYVAKKWPYVLPYLFPMISLWFSYDFPYILATNIHTGHTPHFNLRSHRVPSDSGQRVPNDVRQFYKTIGKLYTLSGVIGNARKHIGNYCFSWLIGIFLLIID